MKSKLFSAGFVCFLSVLLLLTGTVPVFAGKTEDTVDDVREVVDGIVSWNLSRGGYSDVQDWINGALTENAGTTSEWYVFALSRNGDYDFSSYEEALVNYLAENTVQSASSRLKYALILHAVGSTDGYIAETLNDSIGEQGVMSWVCGLHLMNNGYVCDAYTASDVIGTLLSLQLGDGGWALSGDAGNVDVTAMTVQALAMHYNTDPAVTAAVDVALDFLASKQKDNGGYVSYGVNNPESTAQVLTALCSLGMDCTTDERFIRNGNTLIDGITAFRLTDGSFCHKEGGGTNDTATVQAYYSMTAYLRMTEGKSPMYVMESESAETAPVTMVQSDAETTGEPEETVETAVPQPDEPGETAESAETEVIPSVGEEPEENHGTNSVKPWICLGIAGLCGIVCLIFLLTGKRNVKNYIAAVVLCGAAAVIVLVTDFQSADEYYGGEAAVKENAVGTVTLTIRCDTAAGKSDSQYIPADGVILDVTEFAIEEGDSVYDILTEAAQKYRIQLENNGSGDMVYIVGINYLYEYDFGDLSGWVYRVNGEAPSAGCGEYILSDGDEIAWLYSCDLGNDLK